MSFASNIKQELCRHPVQKRCCAVAEAFGILLYGNTFMDTKSESARTSERICVIAREYGKEETR